MKYYYKFYKEYVQSVFFTDANKFLELAKDNTYPNALNKDCCVFSDVDLPLHYITICWDIIFSKYDEYKDKYKAQVQNRKQENDKIKDFFITQQNLNMDIISFRDYANYFYCIEEDATASDCLFHTKEELIKMGHSEVDIDLYCNAEKFDYKNVERLLKEGADPHTEFPDELNCIYRIGAECAFLETELKSAMFDKDHHFNPEEDIANLIGLAAHEKMYNLLTST